MGRQLDVVVVGGGAMGSAAAWQVAQRGSSVVLLERFAAGHHHGASHGATRNFNTAYDRREYLRLLTESRRLWDELATAGGTPLLDLVGLVNHGNTAALQATAAAQRAAGMRSHFLSAGEAMDRWPGMRFRSEALFVPDAGRVRAAEALVALRTAATAHGADFRYDHAVRSIEVRGPERVVVHGDGEEFHARRVIVAAGAWSRPLLSGLIDLPRLRVTQEQPAHFQPLTADLDWPSVNHQSDPGCPEDDYWYSPVYGMLTPGEGIKLGWHGVGPVTDPDARDFMCEPRQMGALQRYAREWFPGLDAERYAPISCTYTSTDSGDFLLDRVGPVIVAAGFSGHGFKFTPVIGRILADLVRDIPAPALFGLAAHR